MQYFVHVYHVVRTKISIEADSQEAACEAADAFIPTINSASIPHDQESVFQGHGVIHHTESAEEVVSYLVDEVGDEEYRNTVSFELDDGKLVKSQ